MAVTSLQHTRFDPARFNEEIAAHGSKMLWRKALPCPCMNPRSGHADPGCPLCDALAVIWDAGTEITVLAPGRRRDDRYDVAGSWLEGFVQLTFPSTLSPGHFDRIDSLVGVMVVNNEFHVRGATNKLGHSTERLRLGAQVIDVEFCGRVNDAGDGLVRYEVPTDFVVGFDGSILWEPGHGPAADTQYSLRYTARPSWVCWSPRERDEAGQKLPYPVSAQRLDFFRRPGVGEGPV